jgi:hypothetical protein
MSEWQDKRMSEWHCVHVSLHVSLADGGCSKAKNDTCLSATSSFWQLLQLQHWVRVYCVNRTELSNKNKLAGCLRGRLCLWPLRHLWPNPCKQNHTESKQTNILLGQITGNQACPQICCTINHANSCLNEQSSNETYVCFDVCSGCNKLQMKQKRTKMRKSTR